MLNIEALDFTSLANATLAFLTAVLIAAAVKIGRSSPKPSPVETKIEGAAIVSSESVQQVAEALKAYTSETIISRGDGEKTRKVGHELVEAIERLTGEVQNVHRTLQTLTTEIARKG